MTQVGAKEKLKGKALIRATNMFAKENRVKSWYYVLSTGLLVAGAFAGTILFNHILLKLALAIMAGLLMSRMFVLYHDYQHEAILSQSLVAKITMTAFGIFALAPDTIWKLSHNHHHDNNSKFSDVVVGSFPIMNKSDFLSASKAARFKYLALRHPLVILFSYLPIFLISFCVYPFVESPRKHHDCAISLLVHGAYFAWIYSLGGWYLTLFSVFIPFAIVCAIGGYIFYAQHNFPSVVLKSNSNWDYVDAALFSSSFIRMNRIFRWITANIGYHHIHHINSRIPFYRLPEVMVNIKELQSPVGTTLDPGEIWRCLQLKFWDEEAGKMITRRELKEAYQ